MAKTHQDLLPLAWIPYNASENVSSSYFGEALLLSSRPEGI